MNIKEYISSGIIESYVLGLSSEHERFEFERFCAQYPELIEARTSFELALEKQAMENAEAPPAYCKGKIWSAIQQAPALNTPKIISMESSVARKTSGTRWGWVAAASIILLLGAVYFGYDFYNESKKLKSSAANLQSQLDSTKNLLEKIAQAQNMTVVNMEAMQKAPPSSANVYWDSTSSNVWLVVRNMPKLPSDKQYQLWAMIDGKPNDLGLFDAKENNFILQMKGAKNAQAFAITIEKRGNSDGPTMEQMQSLGKARL